MKDIVVANRSLTHRDQALRSLIAQLTPEEVEEAIQLIRDLLDDRGSQYVVPRADPPPAERPQLAD